MKDTRISRRGVYYDLTISPYVYVNDTYGVFYRFSSSKKLEIYSRKIKEFDEQLEKLLVKFSYLGEDWINNTRYISKRKYFTKLYSEVEP